MFRIAEINIKDGKSSTSIWEGVDKTLIGSGMIGKSTRLFMIGSWQTGDFGHVYAAIIAGLLGEVKSAALVILRSIDAGVDSLINDATFALKNVAAQEQGDVTVFVTTPVLKDKAIIVMQHKELSDGVAVLEPYDATFLAKDLVKRMGNGQPLTPVWAKFSRGEEGEHAQDFADACQAFFDAYVEKFGMSSGRENFVCLWSRTSGQRTVKNPLGGANPHYDSSELGNEQLCVAIAKGLDKVKTVFLVGPGFNAATKALPNTFDLGEFWFKFTRIKGRLQENGFFDYLTAVYDCDIVHLGMKSGGMDVLGLWGQKVVFLDTVNSPEVTKGRVAAWSTESLLPVEVVDLPSKTGKAIDALRQEDAKGVKTSVTKTGWAQVDERVKDVPDGFNQPDLDRIILALRAMFG